MKHKILLLLFLFSLLPSWGWGQETGDPVTIDLEEHEGGYTIEQNGTYIFTGTYIGKPTQEIEGYTEKAVINVAAGLDLEVTIILSEVEIDLSGSGGCPLSAKDAKMVNLLLNEENTLIAGSDCPGIWAPQRSGCGIIIDEKSGSSGLLTANANGNSPGIGGYYRNAENSYITIAGGLIIANSSNGAGIGSGAHNDVKQITITGGIVNASSNIGAGIGSGENGSVSKITITGGIVNASSNMASGIGIGYGYNPGFIFSTGKNGNAFINARGSNSYGGISDQSYKQQPTTSGIIFDNNKTGKFYGSSVTLSDNATLASDQSLTISNTQTLTIAKGATLTIEPGATLTNNGTIKCDGEINGTIGGNEKVQYAVTYDPNYDNKTSTTEYVDANTNPSYSIDREFYKLTGWFTQSEGGDPVTTITEATTVYAHWEPIPFTIKIPIDDITKTYGTSFTIELTANMFSADISNAGDLKSIELKEHQTLPDGLSFKNSTLSGTPTEVNESGTDITFVVTAGNGISKDATIKFKVNKAELTITPHQDQKIYQDETPTYTVTGAVNNDQITFKGSLAVDKNEVTQGSLVLEESFVKNYDIKFIDNIPIQTLSGNASDVLAILPPSSNNSYTESVTFTAPEGFEIALVSSVTKSDAQLAYNNNFVWDKAGTHEVTYSLRRTAGNKKAYEHSVIVTVGKVSPPDVHPDKPDNTKPVTYKVSLPSVEGIHTNPVADNYDIEAWGSFKFTITIEEGYRMLSLPVVKVNDSEIAFSSRTDTTFTYIIKYIRTPKDIKITGIVKDPATANNAINAPEKSWKIINGVAYITVAKPTIFKVVDMKGNIISTNKLAPGETPIYNLPRAKPIVFWFDKERAVKVIIK